MGLLIAAFVATAVVLLPNIGHPCHLCKSRLTFSTYRVNKEKIDKDGEPECTGIIRKCFSCGKIDFI